MIKKKLSGPGISRTAALKASQLVSEGILSPAYPALAATNPHGSGMQIEMSCILQTNSSKSFEPDILTHKKHLEYRETGKGSRKWASHHVCRQAPSRHCGKQGQSLESIALLTIVWFSVLAHPVPPFVAAALWLSTLRGG